MLEELFDQVYMKFKMQFYKKIFSRFQEREASLTATETFCVEVIYGLNRPTVKEFADFIEISGPNAAYKVQSLIKKGYINKVQSTEDRREYHLEVTDKYVNYQALSSDYVHEVMQRIRHRFADEEIAQLEKILSVMSDELMPEVNLGKKTLK